METGTLDHAAYLGHIRRSAEGFLAAVANGPPDAVVPACPGWTLTQLVAHVGRVHQWATAIVRTGVGPRHPTSGLGPDDDPASWYAARVDGLLSALTEADPGQECWTLSPTDRTAAFWSRRQAHEVEMHRIDAAQAVGWDTRYDPHLAADAVAEVFGVMVPRVVHRAGRLPDLRASLLFRCSDRPQRWVVRPVSAEPGTDWTLNWRQLADAEADPAVDATIEAPVDTILRELWKRSSSERLRVTGDHTAAEAFLASRLTP